MKPKYKLGDKVYMVKYDYYNFIDDKVVPNQEREEVEHVLKAGTVTAVIFDNVERQYKYYVEVHRYSERAEILEDRIFATKKEAQAYLDQFN